MKQKFGDQVRTDDDLSLKWKASVSTDVVLVQKPENCGRGVFRLADACRAVTREKLGKGLIWRPGRCQQPSCGGGSVEAALAVALGRTASHCCVVERRVQTLFLSAPDRWWHGTRHYLLLAAFRISRRSAFRTSSVVCVCVSVERRVIRPRKTRTNKSRQKPTERAKSNVSEAH